MKALSSKRAKALAISQKTKAKVYERDEGMCIICGSADALPEAHFIRRSMGGLGTERNIVSLCRRCHNNYDFGSLVERETLRQIIKSYLEDKYDNWKEEELYYDKYANNSSRDI